MATDERTVVERQLDLQREYTDYQHQIAEKVCSYLEKAEQQLAEAVAQQNAPDPDPFGDKYWRDFGNRVTVAMLEGAAMRGDIGEEDVDDAIFLAEMLVAKLRTKGGF